MGAAFSLPSSSTGKSQFGPTYDATECSLTSIVPTTELIWCPCEDGLFCSRLDVPLDYQNPELGRASVPLIKYPAQENSTDGPYYQGMILVNPGGPGGSGIQSILDGGPSYQALAGSNWDIIGFDPRGIHFSEPVASCSAKKRDQDTTLNSRSVPRISDDFFNRFIRFGADLGSECAEKVGGELDAGPHMSTATTARDMLSIVDAFAETEDGQRAAKPSNLLNYYGVSYGSFLGQTFASMFPDRVGNIVLDGIDDPEDYLLSFSSKSLYHIDGILAAFFIYCHQVGPSECAFHTGSSAKDIYERFRRSFDQLDLRKAEDANWANATDIEPALLQLKIMLQESTYSPVRHFSTVGHVLLGLETELSFQNLRGWTESMEKFYGGRGPNSDNETTFTTGVLCSDQNNRWHNKTLEDFRPILSELENQSIIGDVWIMHVLKCSGWSIKATEIFEGPFAGDTATPILFVGNTYDPVTPFENALSSAPNYKDAQALIIDGLGHGIGSAQNLCGISKVHQYFQTGKMPDNDSFCAFEGGPLGISLNGTLRDNILQAGLSNLRG